MKKAIDIVILPPEKIMDLSIKLNNSAFEEGNASVKLAKDDFLPHISLLMGVIDDSKLSDLEERLENILKDFEKIPVEIEKTGDNWISLKKTRQLQDLHETIVKVCDELLTHEAKNQNYITEKDEVVSNSSYPWVNSFITEYSFEKYQPHITIGNPKNIEKIKLPNIFMAERIAICHLGNHNTCRKILWSN